MPLDVPPPPREEVPRVNISLEAEDDAYLRKRAGERRAAGLCDATRSGVIRVLIREARLLRHDIRQELNAIRLINEGCRRGLYSQAGGADAVELCVKKLVKLIEKAGA